MILCLTPNPALDITYSFAALSVGETHRVHAPSIRAGGKGVNVARVAQSQGERVLALLPLGGITGRTFEQDLISSELPYQKVSITGDTRRSIALVAGGEATVLNEYGSPLTKTEQYDVHQAFRSTLSSAKFVAISGSLPPDSPDEFLQSLILAASGRPTIVDTSGPALIQAAAAGADILKPNHEELQQATGIEDPLAGAHELLSLGAKLIFVSLGARGMLAVTKGKHLHASLPYALEGNPTGAGDAAVAAIAARLNSAGSLSSLNLEKTLRQAVAWSAAAVLMLLAGELSSQHTSLSLDIMITEKWLCHSFPLAL